MAGTVQPQQMTSETAPSTVVMQTALPKTPQPKQTEKTHAKTEKQSKRPEKADRTTRSAKRRISSDDSEQSVSPKKARK